MAARPDSLHPVPGRYRFVIHRDGLAATVQTKSPLAKWVALFRRNLVAITIGRTIHCVGAIEGLPWRPSLLPHEFEHVLQWQRLGTWGFLRRYVWGWLRHGYGPAHPLEAPAIAAGNDKAARDHFARQLADALAAYRRARGLA